jgi:acetylornithine deacetylase/succinyl-diaminopimelate desuccinylase-like protein
MKTSKETLKKIWSKVDEKELIDLAMALVDTHSPTGTEEEVARLCVDWLNDRDIPAFYQEVEPGRGNVVGTLKGSGGGPVLMYNCHLDTALSGDPTDTMFAGPLKPEWLSQARRKGKYIYGSGIFNDKGPFACVLAAAHAVKKSRVKLKGDIVLTGVCGEIGRAPVDQYQGAAHRGKGIGMRYMLTHGVVADYAIVAEPSRFGITTTQAGATFIKITCQGDPMYAPFVEHPENLMESTNAVVRMGNLIAPIEAWARRYQKEHTYKFKYGTVIPKVNIGAIQGGAPFKPNFSPAVCTMYLEAFTPPGLRPLDVLREVEEVIKQSGVEAEAELFLSVHGYESPNADGLVRVMRDAQKAVRGKAPGTIQPQLTSTYADLTILVEMGIPSIKCGPAPSDPSIKPGTGEVQLIGDLVDATKMYSAASVEICNHFPKT